jgi:methylglutamate dehydrogenase subunit C
MPRPEDCPVYLNGAQSPARRGRLGLTSITLPPCKGGDGHAGGGLPGHVGRLEPDRAPDLPHERPARLARGHCRLCPAPRCRAGLTPAGACNGRVLHRRLPARRDRARSLALARWARPPPITPAHGRGCALCHHPLLADAGQGARQWLDFANDVTTKDVKLSAQENFRSVEHMKRYTTQGMAPDQGKNSNVGRWPCWPM